MTQTDKEIFQDIQRVSKEYDEDFELAFPHFALQVFFDRNEEEREKDLDKLDVNDGSIDAFFVQNNEIVICQFKSTNSYRDILKSVAPKDIEYLLTVPERLIGNSLDNHKNLRIQEIVGDYKKYKRKDYKTKLCFFCFGVLSEVAEDRIKEFNENSNNVSIEFYGWNEVKDGLDEYNSKEDLGAESVKEVYIKLAKGYEDCYFDKKIDSKFTFTSIISGSELIRLREKYKYRLFDKNVRFSVSKKEINDKIRETAKDHDERKHFYFYNNGLTITFSTYKKIFLEEKKNNHLSLDQEKINHLPVDKILVKDLSIINGAQTVNSLYEAFKEKKKEYEKKHKLENLTPEKVREALFRQFDEVKVLFRLVQAGESNKAFQTNVINYNNKQNSVLPTDFKSNEPEQKELQKQFAEESYFYQKKQGERKYLEAKQSNKLLELNLARNDFKYFKTKIDIEKLASLYRAWLGEPSNKQVGTKEIFKEVADADSDEDIYKKIFVFKNKLELPRKVREMILAVNMFDLISEEISKYNKIINKLIDKYEEQKDERALNELIKYLQDSLVIPKTLKSNIDSLKFNIDKSIQTIRDYKIFSQSKYQMLALFNYVFGNCNYVDKLIQRGMYKDKEFLQNSIVSSWLQKLLNVLKSEYNDCQKTRKLSTSAFYLRNDTFVNLQKRLDEKVAEENKTWEEYFELKL